MKLASSKTIANFHHIRLLLGAMGALGVAAALVGCSKAPEAPTPAQQQQALDTRVQSIQNNPNMTAQSKEQAIAGITAQQNRTSTNP